MYKKLPLPYVSFFYLHVINVSCFSNIPIYRYFLISPELGCPIWCNCIIHCLHCDCQPHYVGNLKYPQFFINITHLGLASNWLWKSQENNWKKICCNGPMFLTHYVYAKPLVAWSMMCTNSMKIDGTLLLVEFLLFNNLWNFYPNIICAHGCYCKQYKSTKIMLLSFFLVYPWLDPCFFSKKMDDAWTWFVMCFGLVMDTLYPL